MLNHCCSLIPRPFPPPVFDRLQYANMEGEGREIWSCAVISGRWSVDTQGAVPNKALSVPSVQGLEARALAGQHDTVRHSRCQGQFDMKQELLLSDTTPHVSTLPLST